MNGKLSNNKLINIRKISSLILCFALVCSTFSGCSAASQKSDESGSSASNESGMPSDSSSQTSEYEQKLFSEDVIKIDITASEDDWNNLLENAVSKPTIQADVSINGDTFKSCGVKTKGNTSLSQIAGTDSDRYSLKINFGKYVDGQTCYGLDKLVLNNIYADSTYLKEYMSYDLFRYMDVPASLCTFADIYVNGEHYGFYLAIEDVESSFLDRNYGESSGVQAYKPEGMEAGGAGMDGKDKFQNFNPDDNTNNDLQSGAAPDDSSQTSVDSQADNASGAAPDGEIPNAADGLQAPPDGEMPNAADGMQTPPDGVMPNAADGMPTPPDGGMPDGADGMPTPPDGGMPDGADGMPTPPDGGMPDGADGMPTPPDGGMPDGADGMPTPPDGQMPGGKGGRDGSAGGVSLEYSDDEISSYSNIFDNSITKSDDEDYKRVIEAIKGINEGDDPEKYIDVDEVLRYTAANVFLVNLDSYFSSMAHNYCLAENNTVLSMIPWDYNLSFGSFQSHDASSVINYAVDTVFEGVTSENRPIIGKLLEKEENMETYHKYLRKIAEEYVNGGIFEKKINDLTSVIDEYVKNDETSFDGYDAFTKGVEALKLFGTLRSQSILGQLDGSIPSITDEQKNSDALIDSSSLDMSLLGTMNMGGKMGADGQMGRPDKNFNTNGFNKKQETTTETQTTDATA